MTQIPEKISWENKIEESLDKELNQSKVKDSSKLRHESRCGDFQSDVESFHAQHSLSSPGEERIFKCEICRRTFSTKHGLFIHFGKLKANHFPCKEKFKNEIDPSKNQCLRVFITAKELKQHQTEQAMHGYLRHHNPKHDFPNLVAVK